MASLSQTRCFNHVQREAVARCPSCRRHFCRECVTEHEHRLLCEACLRAEQQVPASSDRSRAPFRAGMQLFASVFILWIAFYIVGQTLLLVPSEFHDSYDTLTQEMGVDDLDSKPPGTDADDAAEPDTEP